MVWKGNSKENEKEQISKTKVAKLTKLGAHTYLINLYLHKFLNSFYFLALWTNSMVWKENLAIFEEFSERKIFGHV